MSEPRRRCKGYRIDGKRCQRPLKGRQRAYCSPECRVPAEKKQHARSSGNYYQRNKDTINERSRNQRLLAKEERLLAIEKGREQQEMLRDMGIIP